jgi:hypothetical protein
MQKYKFIDKLKMKLIGEMKEAGEIGETKLIDNGELTIDNEETGKIGEKKKMTRNFTSHSGCIAR